jgi:hypothetical protein
MGEQYIFFDTELCDRFAQFATARNIPVTLRPDDMEDYVVGLREYLADDIDEAVEKRV